MARPVKLCAASRLSQAAFLETSWLGRSLRHFPKAKLPRLHLVVDNGGAGRMGLPEAYNRTLDKCADEDILVLCHDDVYLHDWLLVDRLQAAMARFDVVGVAGSETPDLSQPSWLMRFDAEGRCLGQQAEAGPSGMAGHGDPALPIVSFYGESPAPCVLLDGLLLALDVGKVRASGVRFDPAFEFHCYDTDFCRSAHAAGLRLGTWPLYVTHQSEGDFSAPAFVSAARVYADKWALAGARTA